MNQTHLTSLRFDELTLHPTLKAGLSEAGFVHCTPIQAESLPVALRGEDVAGQAQTGTGKTAAFLLALFNQLLSGEGAEAAGEGEKSAPRAIVIAPTRELALQIHHDARVLGKHTNLRIALAYGGTDYEKQRDEIAAGIDLLVGTPGRLIDYYKQGVYTLDRIEVVVLDEADRMFDLGFIKDMRYLLRRMPPPDQRLNMLFSATLSHRVMELAYEHMNDPRTITIESDSAVADNIREVVYYPANTEKLPLLVWLLRELSPGRSLVFTNTRHAADRIGDWLNANGFSAAVLTGDVPQKKRESLLKAFTDGRCHILIATDVAARGLHIPDVSHVFNFDLPQDAEDYVHRIGRTARAGASGDAVSFACEDYAFHLLDIEEFIGHQVPREEIDPGLLPQLQRPTRRARDTERRDGRDRQGRGERGGRDGGGRDRSNRRPRRPTEGETSTAEPGEATAHASAASFATDELPPEELPYDEFATSEFAGGDDPSADDARAVAQDTPVQLAETATDDEVEEPAAVARSTATRQYSRTSKWNNPNIEVPAIG